MPDAERPVALDDLAAVAREGIPLDLGRRAALFHPRIKGVAEIEDQENLDPSSLGRFQIIIVLRRKIENAFLLFDHRPVDLVADPAGAGSLDQVEEFVHSGPILAEVRLDAEKAAAPDRQA
jgi:hypothetical protein